MDGLEVYDARDDDSNPFSEDALQILIVKEINDTQLKGEIDTALNADVSISMKDTRTPGERRIWITPRVDDAAMTQLVEDHQNDPQWGRGPMDTLLAPAVEKLRAGKVLTTKEISAVLRALV